MSKATGVKGYTPERLRRSQDAAERLERHRQRTAAEQLALLDSRPGEARKERMRLERALSYDE